MRFLYFKDICCFGISSRSINKKTDLNNGMEASLPFVLNCICVSFREGHFF